KNTKHSISVVLDRLVMVNTENTSDEALQTFKLRLADAIEKSLNLANGLVVIDDMDLKKSDLYSSRLSCPESGFAFAEIEPRCFSFNSPIGACSDCEGLGQVRRDAFSVDI